MTSNDSQSNDELDEARLALAEHRWGDAMELLPSVDARDLTADDLERYGEAAWWSGRLGRAIDLRERAFAAHVAAGDRRRAAGTALRLANDYSHRLDSAMAKGWIRRAERMLADVPESAEHAYLERPFVNAAIARGDFVEAVDRSDRILAIAERLGDRDVEALGLQDKGRALIAAGHVDEGMSLIDEAVVAAVSGGVSPYPTAVIYCNATVACEDLTDYRRASEFAEAAKRWCDRQAIAGFPGMCRVRRVELIRLRGAWAEAEAEARTACAELADFCLDYAGEGFYQIGEIRLRMGDLDGAERAFAEAHQMGRDPQPGLALLRQAQGRTDTAAALLERALGEAAPAPLTRARLLPARVEVALAGSALEAASAAADELRQIAEQYDTHVLRASAATAAGQVALAQHAWDAAIEALRRASRTWLDIDAPYESGVARTLLAEAFLGSGDADAAAMELDAAAGTFERLGAMRDEARVKELRRRVRSARGTVGSPPRAVRALMFTDIVRSTTLIEAVGDDAWARLRAWHDDTIRGLVRDHHGEEVDHAGDGFFVAFESPDAAIACALGIRDRLREQRERHGFAPPVRIGIHTAETLATGSGYEGRGVHVAARICALAGADEILVSREVLDAASSPPPTSSGPRAERLRGIAEPVEVAALA